MTERELHKAVYAFFSAALADDVLWHHSQNETPYGRSSRAAFSGRDVGACKGWPDWELSWRDTCDAGRMGFIELKAPGRYPSPEQRGVLQMLRDHGHRVAVCRSVAEVEGTLAAWRVPMRARVTA